MKRGKKNNRRGRPKGIPQYPFTLQTPVKEDMLKAVRIAAATEGMTPPGFIRKLILDYLANGTKFQPVAEKRA